MRRVFAGARAALAAMVIAGCADQGITDNGRVRASVVRIAPVLSASAHSAALPRASALDVDRVRVVIVRPPADTLVDTTVTVGPGAPEVSLVLEVAAPPGETLSAGVDLMSGNVVLYSGTAPVTVLREGATGSGSPPVQITLEPVGPGASAATVSVSPSAGNFPATGPVQFTARAFGSSGAEIVGALFAWSVDNAAAGSVSDAGVVTPAPGGGVLTVRATTLNGVVGSSTVAFFGAPAAIVKVSGDAQSAAAGTALPQSLVIEVQDGGGRPVVGAAVSWSVAGGGGTLGTAQATTGPDGRASASFTLPTASGATAVLATVGALQVSFVADAVPGPATVLQVLGGDAQTDVVGSTLGEVVVRVADQFGNGVAGRTVVFAVGIGGGSVAAQNGGVTDAFGVARAFWTLGLLEGTQTLIVSSAGLSGSPRTVTAIAVAQSALGLTGVWTGDYSWTCGGGGTATITFSLTQAPGSPFLSGTVSYLGASTTVSGARYSSAQFGQFGDIVSGTHDPDGGIIQLDWAGTGSFVNNVFTGSLEGTSIGGSTLNGEFGRTGCSEPSGPAGFFVVNR